MEGRRGPPTYLNYQNNATTTTPIPPPQHSPNRPPPPPPPPPQTPGSLPPTNTLLIYISGAPSPNMHVFLSTILSRYSISEAWILAASEAALKLARMDLYTAAGKLRQDIAVYGTVIREEEGSSLGRRELEEVVGGKLEGKTLSGVLCCQHLESTRRGEGEGVGGVERSMSGGVVTMGDGVEMSQQQQQQQQQQTQVSPPRSARDLLDFDEVELEESWRTNVLTIHTLARFTVPLLRRAPLHPSPFFCLDTSLSPSPLDTVAQATLMHHLSSSPASQGLRFGLASEELIPAPPPSPPSPVDVDDRGSEAMGREGLSLRIPGGGYGNGNGNGNGVNGAQNGRYSPLPSPMGESPTKLWASWAMMNE